MILFEQVDKFSSIISPAVCSSPAWICHSYDSTSDVRHVKIVFLFDIPFLLFTDFMFDEISREHLLAAPA